MSIDEDCYKPIITNGAFNNNYIQYESKGNKEKMNTCHNNPEKSLTIKINKHTPSGYSLFTHCSFDTTKNKFDYYRSKNCIKNFCLDLKEHATKIIDYEKKEMIPLTKKEEKMHNKQKV